MQFLGGARNATLGTPGNLDRAITGLVGQGMQQRPWGSFYDKAQSDLSGRHSEFEQTTWPVRFLLDCEDGSVEDP